ncbi:MAG: hypothetical protein Q9187_004848 [Circinaria calcarea]
MDPLSIAAGIITIVGVGGQAAKAVRKLASLKGAPDLVLALNNEISDLHLVVLAIQDVFKRQQTSGLSFPGNRALNANVDASITNSLQYAKEKVVELEALHNRLTTTATASGSSDSTAFNKGAWLREQKRVKKMQEDLRNVRLKLASALSVLNSSTLLRIQEGVQATQNNTAHLQTLQHQYETAQRQRAIGQENSIQVIQDKTMEMQTLQKQSETAQAQRAAGHESSVQAIQDKIRDLQHTQQGIANIQSQRLAEYETAVQKPISQVLVAQQSLELKLDLIEARRIANNAESGLRAATQSFLNSRSPLDRSSTSSTVGITASMTRWQCPDSYRFIGVLFYAITSGRTEVCQLLLHAGADPYLENYQSILSRSVINESDAFGRTALWWAARRADSSKISLLLKYGADANIQSSTGEMPLMTAIYTRNQTCIRLLLDAGSEIHYRDPQGWASLHLSCYYGSDIDIVEALLRGVGDIDDRLSSGYNTSLMLAAQGNHIHIVKYLISRGAKLNATDIDGESSLHVALSGNCLEVLRFLLQHKASHCLKTKAGEGLLHYAAQFGNVESLKVLNAFCLDGIDPEDRITGVSPQQIFKVKGLTALEIAEQRTDVTPEWRAMFRKLVHGIRFPESKGPELSTVEETEEFEDALESQD